MKYRSVISLHGDDRINFLQSIVTNDVEKTKSQHATWAALLSPQGKFLHDFFIFSCNDTLFLTCEKDREDDLISRLERLKLRAKVIIKKEDTLKLFVLWNPDIPNEHILKQIIDNVQNQDSLIFSPDPRLENSGIFIISKQSDLSHFLDNNIFFPTPFMAYEKVRIKSGLPDGSRDMPVEKSFILENGFKELNGIDFNKGCYIGQEVTARMHYRGLIKKRLVPVHIDGPPPLIGSLLNINNKKVGIMMSSVDKYGLALINFKEWSKLKNTDLKFSETVIKPSIQEWMKVENF